MAKDIRIVPSQGQINVTGEANFRGDSDSSVLFVSASGNVGVNNTSPAVPLDVSGQFRATALTGNRFGDGTDTTKALSILNSTMLQGDSTAISLGRNASNNNQAEITFNLAQTGSSSNRLSLGLYNSDNTLNILGSGKVGIGTSSPSWTLTVDAGVTDQIARFKSNDSNSVISVEDSDDIAFFGTSNNTAYFGPTNGLHTSNLNVDTTGKVGIGVTTPHAALHINHFNKPQLLLDGGGDTNGDIVVPTGEILQVGHWNNSTSTYTDRFRIVATGQIKLSTYGSGTFTGTAAHNLAVDSSGNIIETAGASIDGLGSSRYFARWVDSNTITSSSLYEKSNGYIGLGTTNPTSLLDVRGEVNISGGHLKFNPNGYSIIFDHDGTRDLYQVLHNGTPTIYLRGINDYIQWEDDATEPILRLAQNKDAYFFGSVGIGSTDPQARLHVSGTNNVLLVEGSGSTLVDVQGSEGQLFTVVDSLQGSLFSVSDISGLPILEVFDDDKVVAGTFGQNTLVVTGSSVGIGTDAPTDTLDVAGNAELNTNKIKFGHGSRFINLSGGNEKISTFNDLRFHLWDGVGYNEKVRFTQEGSVGIGTSAPRSGYLLALDKSTNVVNEFVGISFEEAGGTGYGYIRAEDQLTPDTSFVIGHTSRVLTFETANNERVRIDNNGNVGIGTTNPSDLLHLQGGGMLLSQNGTYQTGIINGTGAQLWLTTQDENGDQARKITITGNSGNNYSISFDRGLSGAESSWVVFDSATKTVGINDTTPGSPLVVVGENDEGKWRVQSYGGMYFGNNSDVGYERYIHGRSDGGLSIGRVSGSLLTGGENGYAATDHDHLYIAATGRVGIGTTNPAYKIHGKAVESGWGYSFQNATGDEDVNIYMSHGGGYGIAVDSTENASNKYLLKLAGGTGGGGGIGSITRMIVTAAGNVGIGTGSPADKLHVQAGDIRIDDPTNGTIRGLYVRHTGITGNVTSLVQDTSGSPRAHLRSSERSLWLSAQSDGSGVSTETLRLYNNQNLGLVVDYSGSIGIGTTAPENKLHLLTSTTDTTQQLLIQNNSTGDAAIKFNISGDTYSVGIDNSDSDKFKISYGNLGNNDRITIDSNGNIGIGDSSPTYKLDVAGTGYFAGLLYTNDIEVDGGNTILVNNSSAGHITIGGMKNEGQNGYLRGNITFTRDAGQLYYDASNSLFTHAGGGSTDWSLIAHHSDGFRIYSGPASNGFSASYADFESDYMAMFIDGNGSIQLGQYGSGNNTGTVAYRLGIDSSGNLIEEGLGAGAVDGLGAVQYIARWEDTDTLTTSSMYETAAGSIGIGTVNPTSKLQVIGQAKADNFYASATNYGVFTKSILFDNTENDGNYYTEANGLLAFDENFYLDTGYGTGTYDPAQAFTTNGGGLVIKNEDGWGALVSSQNMRWLNADFATLVVSGSAGIGTDNPAFKLQTNHGTTSEYVASFRNTADNLQLKVGTTTGALLNIQGSTINNDTPYRIGINADGGSVGIGTTAPTANLEVYGNEVDTVLKIHEDAGTNVARLHLRSGGNDTWIQNTVSEFTIRTETNLTSTPAISIGSTSGDVTFGYGVNVTGDLTVEGIVTAQEFHTEFVSASIVYQSGSTQFGNSADDTHNFDGQLTVQRDPGASQGTVMVIENTADHGSSQDLIIKNDFDRDIGIKFQTGGGTYYQWVDSNGDDAMIFSAAGSTRTTDSTIILTQGHNLLVPNGSVGIGVTPSYPLDVSSGTATWTARFQRSGTPHIKFENATQDGDFAVLYASNTLFKLARRSGSNDEQDIWLFGNSDGNVGIGTDSPQKKLDVRGGYFMTNDGSGKETAFVQGGTGYAYFGNLNAGPAAFGNSDDWTTLVADGGCVGIGTTSPDGKLHVHSGLAHNNVYINTDSSGGTGYDVNLYLNGGANNSEISINMGIVGNEDRDRIKTYQGNMYFRTNDSENMILDSSGNLGIGTDSPSTRLTIQEDVADTIDLSTTGTSSPKGAFVELINASGTTGSGVGITARGLGTKGRYGAIAFVDETSDNNGTGGHIQFHTSPSKTGALEERMRISKEGYVGIGTTNPTAQLHVTGSRGAGFSAVIDNSANDGHGLYIKAGGTSGTRYITQWRDAAGTERFHMDDTGEAYFQNSITSDSSIAGASLYTDEYVYHTGDTNTYMRMDTDVVQIFAGGVEMMRWQETTQDRAVININQGDVDFYVGTTQSQYSIFAEGSTGRVGINTNSVNAQLYINNDEAWSAQDLGSSSSGSVAFGIKGRSGATHDLIISSNGTTDYTMQVVQDADNAGDININPYGGGVGIGRNHAGHVLDIMGSTRIATATGDAQLILTHNENNRNAKIIFMEDEEANYKWTMGYDDGQSNRFFFNAYETNLGADGSNTAMTLDPNTLFVGINTTDPQAILDIQPNSLNTASFHIGRYNSATPLLEIGEHDNMGTAGSFGGAMLHAENRAFGISTENQSTFGDLSNPVFFIESNNGNVGIGTTSPDDLFHVHGGDIRITSTSPKITIANSDTSIVDGQVIGQVDFRSLDSSTNMADVFGSIRTEAQGTLDNGVNDGGKMVFSTFKQSTTLVDQMVIDRDGNVGIGTTAPTANLHVLGNNNFATDKPSMISEAVVSMKPVTGSSGNLNFASLNGGAGIGLQYTNYAGTADWDIALQPFGGNVGIGVTEPDAALTIDGDIHLFDETGDPFIKFSVGNTIASPTKSYVIRVDNSAGDKFQIRDVTKSATRISLDTNGNVGIGTDSVANAKLRVEGGGLDVESSTDSLRLRFYSGSQFQSGIQAVLNTGEMISNSAVRDFAIRSQANMLFAAGGSAERMRIDSNGNVGIGLTNPSYDLEVNGKIATPAGAIVIEGQEIYANSEYSGNDGSVRINRFGYLGGQTKFRDTVIYNGKGNQIMTIDGSTSYVGIGTTIPNTPLDIVANSGGNSLNLRMRPTSDDYSFIQGKSNDGTEVIGEIAFNRTAATTGNLLFYTANGTNSLQRMQIHSEGDVGIGATPHTAGATWRTLYIGSSATIISRQAAAGTDMMLANNHYIDSSNVDKRITAGGTSRLFVNEDVIRFQRSATGAADSTITWSESMRIESDGDVGIGTTAPQYKLHIHKETTGDSNRDAPTGGILFTRYRNNNDFRGSGIFHSYRNNGGSDHEYMAFAVADANDGTPMQESAVKMVIDEAGKVGIGTTSPDARLHVSGTNNVLLVEGSGSTLVDVQGSEGQLFTVVDTLQGSLFSVSDISGLPILEVFDDDKVVAGTYGQNTLVVTGSKVGIGTAVPGGKLTIQDTSNQVVIGSSWSSGYHDIIFAAGSANSTSFTQNNTAARIQSLATAPGGAATGDLLFTVNSGDTLVDALYIQEDGNVGIGTTSPGAKLDVRGVSRISGDFAGTGQDPLLEFYNTDASLGTDQILGTIDFHQSDPSGNGVGIVSRIRAINESTFKGQAALTFHTGEVGAFDERLRIDSVGNVGIGTTNPTATLHLSAPSPYIYLDDTSTGGTRTRFQILNGDVGTTQSALFGFNNTSGTSTLQVLAINESGKVGIGTTVPGAKLHVAGNMFVEEGFRFGTTSNQNLAGDGYSGNLGLIQMPTFLLDQDLGTGDGRAYGVLEPASFKPSSKILGDSGYDTVAESSAVSGLFPNVKGEADVPIIDANVEWTYADAVEALETVGARLPTLPELMASVGAGSGQSYDDKYLWTQTSAGHGKVWVCRGDGVDLPDAIPVSVTGSYRTRAFWDISKANLPVYYDDNSHIRGKEIRAEHSDGLKLGDDAGNGIFIQDGGNVGIGIASPENKLHLGPNSGNVKLALEWSDSHSATSGEAYSTIYTSGQGGSYPFSGRGNLVLQPRNNDVSGFGDLVVMTGATATPKFVVQAGGNVGIGASSPNALLEIRKNAGADPSPITDPVTFRLTDAGNAATGQGDTTNPWAKIEFYSEDASSGGPAVQAQIATIYDDIYSAGSHISFSNTSTPANGLSEKMRINSNGSIRLNSYGAGILQTDANGNVSAASAVATATNANNVEVETTTASSVHHILFSDNTNSGTTYEQVYRSAGLYYTPNNSALYSNGEVVAYASSDSRLKDNKFTISNALDKISKIGGYEFDWNDNQDVHEGHDVGVLAQEIEEVLPEVVTTREDGYKAVKYEKIVPLLVEGIKEQKDIVEKQQSEINELKAQIKAIQDMLKAK